MKNAIELNKIQNERWMQRKVLSFEEAREKRRIKVKNEKNMHFYKDKKMDEDKVKKSYTAVRG